MVEKFATPFDYKTAPIKFIEGIPTYHYLMAGEYWQIIDNLADSINPTNAVVVYNLQGAKIPFEDIWSRWQESGVNLAVTTPHPVQYSSSNTDATSGFIKPIIPVDPDIVSGRHVKVIDDMGDTNGSTWAIIRELSKFGVASYEAAVLTLKESHPRQIFFPYSFVGAYIRNVWSGGFRSLDFNTPEVPPEFPRAEESLVVRVQPEDKDQVLWQLDHGLRLRIT